MNNSTVFLSLQIFDEKKKNLKCIYFAFFKATFFDNLAHISLHKPSLKNETQSFTYEKDKNGQQLLFFRVSCRKEEGEREEEKKSM